MKNIFFILLLSIFVMACQVPAPNVVWEQRVEQDTLGLGDRLPSISLHSNAGTKRLPDDYRGLWLLLYLYDHDFDPVAATDLVSLNSHLIRIRNLEGDVLAIGRDHLPAHLQWLHSLRMDLKNGISFPLASDAGTLLRRQLGLENSSGKKRAYRAILLIDPRGVIRQISFFPREIGLGAVEIVRSLEALRKSDASRFLMPADWPVNALVKDAALQPVPDTLPAEGKAGYSKGCPVWWFCARK